MEVFPIKVAEQEELVFKYNREEIVSKDQLYEKLIQIGRNIQKQEILIIVSQDKYQVLYFEDTKDEYKILKVWPAFRYRVEVGWNELKENLKHYDNYLDNKGYLSSGEKYCNIKQIIAEDDYFIIDIYAKKERKPEVLIK
ncbi:hypothetical protein [Pseudobutyrivibrio sp.]|uniref:hypothetical protein n=1 Tax=Pseudobutyrivibrio sp. TaxID=2014367 RepID=UPI0038638C34